MFSGGGEGVEVVKNEPYDGVPLLNGKFTSGQYTYKIYHLQSKVSIIIITIIKGMIWIDELNLANEQTKFFKTNVTLFVIFHILT